MNTDTGNKKKHHVSHNNISCLKRSGLHKHVFNIKPILNSSGVAGNNKYSYDTNHEGKQHNNYTDWRT